MIYTKEELTANIRVVAERYDIQEIYLFGSYADGIPTEESDVDLIVKYGDGCRGLDCIQFMNDLEAHLGKEVDVLNIEFLPDFLNNADATTEEKRIYFGDQNEGEKCENPRRISKIGPR